MSGLMRSREVLLYVSRALVLIRDSNIGRTGVYVLGTPGSGWTQIYCFFSSTCRSTEVDSTPKFWTEQGRASNKTPKVGVSGTDVEYFLGRVARTWTEWTQEGLLDT